MSSAVAENGEHGAIAIRVIAPNDGSCQRSIAASLAASTASCDSTTSSGGSPPADWPRSIDPRVGWNRTPTSRAARISAASRSAGSAPAGNTYRWSVLVVQPVRASQARLAAAESCTSSGVSRAHTGYSAASQPNSVSSVA